MNDEEKALAQRLYDKAFQWSGDPILEDAARLIERLAGELAEAKAQNRAMAETMSGLSGQAKQLAARDAELKVARDLIQRVWDCCPLELESGTQPWLDLDAYHATMPDFDALAKLTKKAAT